MGQDQKNMPDNKAKEKESAELAAKEKAEKEAAEAKALADKESAELAAKEKEEQEKSTADKVMKPRMFRLKKEVANVFIDGQKYTHRDNTTFADSPSVQKKFKAGFLEEVIS